MRLVRSAGAPAIVDAALPTAWSNGCPAADARRCDLAPKAAGALALSVAPSRQDRDGLQPLRAGMAIHDTLNRWARGGRGAS